jgi:hypothetical protein
VSSVTQAAADLGHHGPKQVARWGMPHVLRHVYGKGGTGTGVILPCGRQASRFASRGQAETGGSLHDASGPHKGIGGKGRGVRSCDGPQRSGDARRRDAGTRAGFR